MSVSGAFGSCITVGISHRLLVSAHCAASFFPTFQMECAGTRPRGTNLLLASCWGCLGTMLGKGEKRLVSHSKDGRLHPQQSLELDAEQWNHLIDPF